MATIVYHTKRKAHYILLGGGFGASRSAMSSPLYGALRPIIEDQQATCALVSDAQGALCWVRTEYLDLVSVDGRHPAELLPSED